MIKSNLSLFSTLCLFLLLIGMALKEQTPAYLYAAGGLPIVIICLPLLNAKQYMSMERHVGVSVVKQAATPYDKPDMLVVSFPPGYVQWHKKILYVPVHNIAMVTHPEKAQYTASLRVLNYDLLPELRKGQWVGIKLSNLVERTKGLSYTTNEVNRLIIRLEDLPSDTHVRTASSSGRSELQV